MQNTGKNKESGRDAFEIIRIARPGEMPDFIKDPMDKINQFIEDLPLSDEDKGEILKTVREEREKTGIKDN